MFIFNLIHEVSLLVGRTNPMEEASVFPSPSLVHNFLDL